VRGGLVISQGSFATFGCWAADDDSGWGWRCQRWWWMRKRERTEWTKESQRAAKREKQRSGRKNSRKRGRRKVEVGPSSVARLADGLSSAGSGTSALDVEDQHDCAVGRLLLPATIQ
jgi:hypothetical protein